jgi:acyl-coenzyme A thioesterase PaaI-like protein
MDTTEERAAARRASHVLADQLRRVIARLAVVRPPAEDLLRAAEVAEMFADRLGELPVRQRSWEVSEAGLQPHDFVAHSPVSGRNNPVAPPVILRLVDGSGSARWADHDRIEGEVTFGPAYEGPPGHCHGGMVAAMFDELLGFAQPGPGFTAYLHIDYRRPTPLGRRLDLASWIDRTEGRKRYIRGTCSLDGVVLAEAEGLFIAPRGDGDYLARLGVTP